MDVRGVQQGQVRYFLFAAVLALAFNISDLLLLLFAKFYQFFHLFLHGSQLLPILLLDLACVFHLVLNSG